MENASKALIIAGSVLISILLISVGILIFNATKDISGTELASEMEISAFNGDFEQYESTNLSATQTKALIRKINASNSTKDEQIFCDFGAASTVLTNRTYNVELIYHTATHECNSTATKVGFICQINITENS